MNTLRRRYFRSLADHVRFLVGYLPKVYQACLLVHDTAKLRLLVRAEGSVKVPRGLEYLSQ